MTALEVLNISYPFNFDIYILMHSYQIFLLLNQLICYLTKELAYFNLNFIPVLIDICFHAYHSSF